MYDEYRRHSPRRFCDDTQCLDINNFGVTNESVWNFCCDVTILVRERRTRKENEKDMIINLTLIVLVTTIDALGHS